MLLEPPAIYTVVDNAWVPVANSEVDSAHHVVKAAISHFSIYAILTSTDGERQYELVDLGALAGDTYSEALSVNNNGEIVVQSKPSPSSGQVRSAIWHSGMLMDIGQLNPQTNTFGRAININGIVVGQSVNPGDQLDRRAFILKNGTMSDLFPLVQGIAGGIDVNASGEVLANVGGTASILSSDGTVGIDIADFAPLALNNSGHALGNSGAKIQVFRNGNVEEIDSSGYQNVSPQDMNDSDAITGRAVANNTPKGFVYDGTYHTFGPLVGGTDIFPNAINNLGEVVGQALGPVIGDQSFHAFLYAPEGLLNLTTKIPAGSPFVVLSTARSINDQGWIVGQGKYADGTMHGFLLRPTVG